MSKCFRPISGNFDVVALEPQRAADRIPQRFIIIDYDDPYRHPEPPFIAIAASRFNRSPMSRW
jgi:hypothetical protein